VSLAYLPPLIPKLRSMTQTPEHNVPTLRFPGFEGAWELVSLSQKVMSIKSGRTKHVEVGKHPVYGSTGLLGFTDQAEFEGQNLLVARVGANAGQLNRADGIYGVTDNTLVITPSDQINLGFLEASLRRCDLNRLVFGSGQPLITGTMLKRLKREFPTLPEQCKIAHFLGVVDKKIAQLSRKKGLLEDYKKGCMQQLFSQKIRFKDDEGNDFQNWEEKQLGEVVTVDMGQSPSSDSYNDEGEGLPLIQGNADIKNRKTAPRRFTTSPTKTCLEGDILISVRAPIGEIAKATLTGCLGRGMGSIRPKFGNTEFWYQFLLHLEPTWDSIGHGLIQAFSRTNRTMGAKKSQGNVVAFRNLKPATDKAIELFANKDAQEDIILAPYEDYVKKFEDATAALLAIVPTVDSVDDLLTEEDEAAFIKAFRDVIRVKNVLECFSQFDASSLPLDEQTFADYRSKYLDLYDKVRSENSKEKVSILDDLDFEIELISRDKINVSYIINLLRGMENKTPEEKAKTRKTIMDVLDTEAQLRSKKELIERFIAEHFANLPANSDVGTEFDSYWEAQKQSALVTLSEDEGLKREELDKVLANYLFTEKTPMRDDVIGIMEKRPSLRERSTVAERVIAKIK